MKANCTQKITFTQKPKHGWDSRKKLQELVKKEFGYELRYPNNLDIDKMWIEDEDLSNFDMKRFKEMVKEAETYGKKKNEEEELSYKTMDEQNKRIRREIEKDKYCCIEWSMEVDDLDDIAVKGDVVFVERYNFEFRSKKIKNPTWIDVAKIVNDMVAEKWPEVDHVFLESITKSRSKPKLAGTKEYEIFMGS